VFTTTLTLEERIARAQTQLVKAKENRRKAYEKAAKAEKKVERLIAKRPAGKPEIVDAKPTAVQEVVPLPLRRRATNLRNRTSLKSMTR
jgi:hypothetical protein